MTLIRPMLAAPTKEENLRALKFPKLMSAKIDGVRALNIGGTLVSRKLLPIPNKATQCIFGDVIFHGLDGELAVGSPTDKNLMQQTTSGVMSDDGDPKATWYIFDKWDEPRGYAQRAREAKSLIESVGRSNVVWLPQHVVRSYEDILEKEEAFLSAGYEGAILRDPIAPYKQNRSTVKQEWMLKVKRFTDSEAVIIGCVEQQTNTNEATVDETGYTKRSHAKGGKVAAGVLGTLQVRDIKTGVEFELGTGFTYEQRANLWAGREYLPGKLVKYKYFPIGIKDKPRHPVFIGFRDRRDL